MLKFFARAVWFGPVLLLMATGCHRSAANPTQPIAVETHYTQIDAATAGTISGTIDFIGTAPAPIAIDMAQDPACGLATKKPNMTEQYVIHDGRVANVFVYVRDGLGNRVYAPSKIPIVLDQKGCRFVPHVIGAMAGQTVEFRNSDPTTHNVHIVPPDAADTGGIDISQGPKTSPQQETFSTPILMTSIRCNNHPWMEAFLNVVKNPFFAVSNADGHYEIKGLPPGRYTLAAVQEKLGTRTQAITVESGKTTVANFTFGR
jgi:plastocyanin